LRESALDVLAGITFLEDEGVDAVGLVGHSFGGAVVIQAAANHARVRTIVTLGTQSHGTEPVADLGPRCSLLLVHGTLDRVLPASCSRDVYALAREPRQLRLLPAGHALDEVADDVFELVRDWLLLKLCP
jgi:pimeloyl-ACP methyl ester carboxylesterase